MEKEELKRLFKKYHDGTCTDEEKALLESWYLQYNEHDSDLSITTIKAIGNRLFNELPGNHNTFIKIGLRLAVAAVSLGFLITIGVHFFVARLHQPTISQIHDLRPGTNTAILTLANGRKINLSNAANGQLASQSGIQVIKTANGQITYKIIGKIGTSGFTQTNNIAVPKGGQWQVILPDGSKIWLNSATSFSYPSAFEKQKDRIVQLNGEAYFEVAKNKAHPFIVKTANQAVEVLGTHFNINSYPDEPSVKTTLVEGSVKVSTNSGNTKFLIPGQQSILAKGELSVSVADIEEALAWKNGYFRFNDESIQSIMRKISRWYNIEVQYEGGISNDGLNGKISRFKNISQVLKALEATKTVHFKVEGRRVTVLK